VAGGQRGNRSGLSVNSPSTPRSTRKRRRCRRTRGGSRRHAPLPRRPGRRRAVHRQPRPVPALTEAAPLS